MNKGYDMVELERDIKEILEGKGHDVIVELTDLSETASNSLRQRLEQDYNVREIITCVGHGLGNLYKCSNSIR